MNRDKRPIIYKKVKSFVSNPKKSLRFNLNPHLEKEESLKEDLKLLKTINYDPVTPIESEVHCESFIRNEPFVFVLNEGKLWDFVFSDDWQGYSSIRICDGQLLDTILYCIFDLIKNGSLNTYKMSKFDTVTKPAVPHPFKTKSSKSNRKNANPDIQKRSFPVKIKFTYYGLNNERSKKGSEVTVLTSPNSTSTTLGKSSTHDETDKLIPEPTQIFKTKSISEPSVVSTKSFGTVSDCGDSNQPSTDVNSKPVVISNAEIYGYQKTAPSYTDTQQNVSQGQDDDQISRNIFVNEASTPTIELNGQQSAGISNSCENKSNLRLIESVGNFPPAKSLSTAITDKFANLNEQILQSLSLPGTIPTTESKKGEIQIKAKKKNKKAAATEIIYHFVNFETDYDNIKTSISCTTASGPLIKKSTETKNEEKLSMKNNNVTDPEEHVIELEKEDNFDYYEIKNVVNYNHWKSEENNAGNNKSSLNKKVSFKSCNTPQITDSGSVITRARTPSVDTNVTKEAGDAVVRCPNITNLRNSENSTVYLRIIENMKRKRLGKSALPGICPSIGSSESSTTTDSIKGVGTIDCNMDTFEDMVSDYSVKLFKNNKSINKLKREVPKKSNKNDVINVIENFLEMKFLPKIPIILPKPIKKIKLCPTAFAPKSTLKTVQQLSDIETLSSDIDTKCFEQRVPKDFKDCLLRACDYFIVRKEQVTSSNNWQTVTSVTINRKILEPKHMEEESTIMKWE